MRIKLILPALAEAKSPDYRPIKYSLFPPLGLMTLAGYLNDDDEITLVDEHVEPLALDDEPQIVALEVYVTSARRSYAIADHYRCRGAHVVLGGLHVTAMPDEAAQHADTICLGPGEDTWPAFLADFRAGRPQARYRSTRRDLTGAPFPRRDLIRADRYLCPNAIVVSRGCPHACGFCYKTSFLAGGRGHYVQEIDRVIAEIDRLPPHHLYFLDDHFFGDPRFAATLCEAMRGMDRVFQAAGTVASVLQPGLMEKAVKAGLRSLFVGFESVDPRSLMEQGKWHNLHHSYDAAIARLHDLGVMVNASFVFGMDHDDQTVFDRTVAWAISRGVETATFHILTPYPGTPLFERMDAEGRLLHRDWDLYDTRHAVFAPGRMTAQQLESGYRRAYREFYSCSAILRAAAAHATWSARVRHVALSVAWKKLEPLWDAIIRARLLPYCLPALERILKGFSRPRTGTRRAPLAAHSLNT